ncbi:MAG: hypothetical protein P8X64_13250 [Anaerolineales bacterium]
MVYSDTEYPDIVRVDENGGVHGTALEALIDELVRLAEEGDSQAIVGLLNERVPGSVLGQMPPPDLTSVL